MRYEFHTHESDPVIRIEFPFCYGRTVAAWVLGLFLLEWPTNCSDALELICLEA